MPINSRRYRHKAEYNFWPSFVDALSTLLIVVLFFLTLFVLAHFFLGRNLDSKNNELIKISIELSDLSSELSVKQKSIEKLSFDLKEKSEALTRKEEAEKLLLAELDVLKEDREKSERTLEETLMQVALLKQDIKALTERRDTLEKEAVETADELKTEREISKEAKVHIALLTSRIESMTEELKKLSATLEASEELAKTQDAQIADLGKRLNKALAQKASELSYYRSDFFGKLRKVLENREDIRIEGDRFVFQSELFFKSGSADLEPAGKRQLNVLAKTLLSIASQIPKEVNWVLRVDGHTDNLPINNEKYSSNWLLSADRSISVVKYLISKGVPANRLVAAGFGEFQPIDRENTDTARRKNRRIEFKLTER